MSQKIQKLADETGKEITSSQIWEIFDANYLKPKNNFSYIKHSSTSDGDLHSLKLEMNMDAKAIKIEGTGNGPIDSFMNGLSINLDLISRLLIIIKQQYHLVLMQKLLPILSLKKMGKHFGVLAFIQIQRELHLIL